MSLRTVPKFDLTKFDLAKYPALKPGVNFFKVAGQDCSDIYIGFSNRGIELNFEIAFELLCFFDGSHSLKKIISAISEISVIEVEEDQNLEESIFQITKILQLLSDARLIEFRTSPLPSKLPKKDLLPANLVNSLNRMRAETNLYSWHPQVDNGISAETLISKRRYFSIMIYGRNRLALSLFTVLQASGFSLIKLTDRAYSASVDSRVQIEPDEVCGLAIRGSDVGLRKALVLADLARNSQLFPLESLVFPDLPDLIISTESIPQETMQSWMSENIVHLPISNIIEEKIIIGPIVIPGKTPCLNCLNLWRADQFPHQSSFEILAALDSGEGKGLELPSAQVALLTGLITTQVIQFLQSNQSNQSNQSIKNCTSVDSKISDGSVKLIGATLAINLFDPLDSISSSDETFGYRYWQPHISCGCQRLI
jgi:hypothetical protein